MAKLSYRWRSFAFIEWDLAWAFSPCSLDPCLLGSSEDPYDGA